MKCLDKKRIKMKGGETLALNERIMLSLVSHGVSLLFVLIIKSSCRPMYFYQHLPFNTLFTVLFGM